MVWVVIALISVAVVLLALLLMRRPPQNDSVALMQQQLTQLNETLGRALGDVGQNTSTELHRLHQRIDERLKETSELVSTSQRGMGDRIDRNSQLFSQVQERLARLEETSKQIQTVGTEISKLHDILRAPKLRGNMGELFLEELLAQILPRDFFEMQHRFKSGVTVDAVIRLAAGHLVPVDAKFPLENFQRMLSTTQSEADQRNFRKAFGADFRKHVDQIAAKYILPDEGTLDFALLYVPAENVYYEAILRDEQFGEDKGINAYALSKKVIPVSPNSFYAYLQAIALGLRGFQIQEQTKEIFQFLSRFRGEFGKLQEELDLLGKHLGNAASTFDRTQKRLEKAQMRLDQIEESPKLSEAPVEVLPTRTS